MDIDYSCCVAIKLPSLLPSLFHLTMLRSALSYDLVSISVCKDVQQQAKLPKRTNLMLGCSPLDCVIFEPQSQAVYCHYCMMT